MLRNDTNLLLVHLLLDDLGDPLAHHIRDGHAEGVGHRVHEQLEGIVPDAQPLHVHPDVIDLGHLEFLQAGDGTAFRFLLDEQVRRNLANLDGGVAREGETYKEEITNWHFGS